MPDKKTWIVLTNNESIQEVTQALKQKGFKIDHVLDAIGQIVVQGSEAMKEAAVNIKGVDSIHSSHDDFNIGPPDSNTTW